MKHPEKYVTLKNLGDIFSVKLSFLVSLCHYTFHYLMPVDALHFILNHLQIKLSQSTNDLQSQDINQSIPVSLWMLSVDKPLCQALLFNHKRCLQPNDHVLLIFTYRDMPRAIVIGISLTTVCYLMVNVAYVTVLGSAGILASEAVAVVSLGRHKFPTLHSKLYVYYPDNFELIPFTESFVCLFQSLAGSYNLLCLQGYH